MSKKETAYISKVRSFYNSISPLYFLISFIDKKPNKKGIIFSGPKKNDKVLCIGFGLGEEMSTFSSLGSDTYGIELSEAMIKRAKSRNKVKNTVKGDSFRLPFKDNTFDIVYSSFLIDIFNKKDRIKIIKEMKRIVKAKGKIVSVNNTFEDGIISKMLIGLYLLIRDNLYTRMKTRPIEAQLIFKEAQLKSIKKKKVFWSCQAVKGTC
ncbi:MAG: class I SAM-dependent methyltransferase [archaeon]|nr:class I SAM-dependent methyltransferase [archaeon]